jgi:hypothetical protein
MTAMGVLPLRFRLSGFFSLLTTCLFMASASAQDRPAVEIVPTTPHNPEVWTAYAVAF